jgi:hypothetical protein
MHLIESMSEVKVMLAADSGTADAGGLGSSSAGGRYVAGEGVGCS